MRGRSRLTMRGASPFLHCVIIFFLAVQCKGVMSQKTLGAEIICPPYYGATYAVTTMSPELLVVPDSGVSVTWSLRQITDVNAWNGTTQQVAFCNSLNGCVTSSAFIELGIQAEIVNVHISTNNTSNSETSNSEIPTETTGELSRVGRAIQPVHMTSILLVSQQVIQQVKTPYLWLATWDTGTSTVNASCLANDPVIAQSVREGGKINVEVSWTQGPPSQSTSYQYLVVLSREMSLNSGQFQLVHEITMDGYNKTFTTFKDVLANWRYEARVIAVSNVGPSTSLGILSFTTIKNNPGLVTDLRVSQSVSQSDKVTIVFNCVPELERNGIITGYEVKKKYIPEGADGDLFVEELFRIKATNEVQCEQVTVPTTEQFATIVPGKTYYFSVLAFNDMYPGDFTPEIEFNTNAGNGMSVLVTMAQQYTDCTYAFITCLLDGNPTPCQTVTKLSSDIVEDDGVDVTPLEIVDGRATFNVCVTAGAPAKIHTRVFLINDVPMDIRVNVTALNQPPAFNSAMYSIVLSEHLSPNSLITKIRRSAVPTCITSDGNQTCIEVVDPDKDVTTGIDSVTLNTFFLSATSPIGFNNDAFYVEDSLPPQSSHIAIVTAQDGGFLSSTATIMFTVEDMNDPPVCPGKIETEVMENMAPGSVITQVTCTDSDMRTQLNTISFAMVPDQDVIGVNSNSGALTLLRPLFNYPTDEITATVTVFGSSDDDPKHFEVPVLVRVYIITTCQQLEQTLPSRWVLGSKVGLSLICEQRNVDFQERGNFTQAFQYLGVTQENGAWNFRLNLTSVVDGVYEFTVTMRNPISPNEIIAERSAFIAVVIDTGSAPYFVSSSYAVSLESNSPVGLSILRVMAVSNELQGRIIYEIAETTPTDANGVFAIDLNTGMISVASRDIVYFHHVELTVKASDSATGLSSMSIVSIDIRHDENLPHLCQQLRYSIIINSTISVGEPFFYDYCMDQDIDADSRQLDYSIVDSTIPVRVSKDGHVALSEPYSFEIKQFIFYLRLTSGDLESTLKVNVTVRRLPLTPMMTLVNTSDTSANFTIGLNFSTVDYYKNIGVLRDHVINVYLGDGNKRSMIQSMILPASMTDKFPFFVINNLLPNRFYEAEIVAWGYEGNTTSGPNKFDTLFHLPHPTIELLGSAILRLGESLTLRCGGLDNFNVSYFWGSTNNKVLTEGVNLKLKNVQTEDGGFYQCTVMDKFSRTRISSDVEVQVTDKVYDFVVDHELKLDGLVFDPQLLNKESLNYKLTKGAMEYHINKILRPRPSFVSCEVTGFSKGSLITNVKITERTLTANGVTDVVDALILETKDGTFNELLLDSPIVVTSLGSSMTQPKSRPMPTGSTVILNCSFAVIYDIGEMTNSWSLNGTVIQRSDRFQTDVLSPTPLQVPSSSILSPDQKMHVFPVSITIDNFVSRFVGKYTCQFGMRDLRSGVEYVAYDSVSLSNHDVVPQPTVTLSPASVFIQTGGQVNISGIIGNGPAAIKECLSTNSNKEPVKIQRTASSNYFELSFNTSISTTVFCTISNNYTMNSTSNIVKVTVYTQEVPKCPQSIQDTITWKEAPADSVTVLDCPDGYTGYVRRRCNQAGSWEKINYSNCTRTSLLAVEEKVQNKQDGVGESETFAKDVVNDMETSVVDSGKEVLSGDIKQVARIMSDVGDEVSTDKDILVDSATLEKYATVTDSMLEANDEEWDDLTLDEELKEVVDEDEADLPGAQMLVSMDKIAVASLESSDTYEAIVKKKIAIKRGTAINDIRFPEQSEDEYKKFDGWVLTSDSQAFLSKAVFSDQESQPKYVVLLYRDMQGKVAVDAELQKRYGQGASLDGKVINSDVLALTLTGNYSLLDPPLKLRFSKLETNFTRPNCAFLDTKSGVSGVWSTKGCKTIETEDVVECQCDHLTNFAVLMSPTGAPDSDHHKILGIITAVGCGISLLCLVITVVTYIAMWRYVKSDRSCLHVHLCVCLIIAYIVFLGGIDRTENETACTVIAAALHYFFLVVFVIMLAEGIEVCLRVTVIFPHGSLLWRLLLLAYGFPLVVVGICLGATQTDGYGNDDFCWLSTSSGLIWGFIGPALFVILVNFIILLIVVRVVVRDKSKKVMHTSRNDTSAAKGVVKCILVLTPLIGITWVFGVLAVNEDTLVFQYLFAIFNSLQGLFIFIFHCLLDGRVKEGFQHLQRRRGARSLESGKKFSSSENKSETATSKEGPRRGSALSTTMTASTPVSHHSFDFDIVQKEPASYMNQAYDNRGDGYSRTISEDPGYERKDGDANVKGAPLRGLSVHSNDSARIYEEIPDDALNPDNIGVTIASAAPDASANQGKGFGSSIKNRWRAFSQKRKSSRKGNPDPVNRAKAKDRWFKIRKEVTRPHNQNLQGFQGPPPMDRFPSQENVTVYRSSRGAYPMGASQLGGSSAASSHSGGSSGSGGRSMRC